VSSSTYPLVVIGIFADISHSMVEMCNSTIMHESRDYAGRKRIVFMQLHDYIILSYKLAVT
jgi:hypothetical protein